MGRRLEKGSEEVDRLGHPQEMESAAEKRQRYRSIRIGQFVLFIFATGFSIILTGVYPYMKELSPSLNEEERLARYGWVVAVNPLGQTIASPIFGILYSKTGSARLVGIITSIAYIFGNILYSTLTVFPEDYRYPLLLVSRFIVGACAGNIATVRSYIAAATFTSERTAQMSIASAFQSVGFTVGPGIQAALTPLQCTDIGAQPSDQYISFDMYTSAGWVSAFLGAISLLLFLPSIFQEIDVSAKERQHAQDLQKNKEGNQTLELPKPWMPGILVCLFSFFIYAFNFILVETLGTPMCIDQFGWTEEETILKFGILVAGVGLMCIFLFASVGPLVNRIDERKIMMAGILLMLFGRIFNFPIPGGPLPPLGNGTDIQDSNMMSHYARYYRSAGVTNTRNIPCEDASNTVNPGCELDWCETIPAITVWQLFGGVVVGTIGYPYALSITQSIFSKMLGPRPQGAWMGLLSAFGGLSRVLGPIFVSYIYTYYGTYLTAAIMAGSMVLALIATTAVYKKLVPLEMESQVAPDESEEVTKV